MATVTFIKYAKQSAGALHGVAGYVSQEEKTMQEDGPQLVSGQNCNPQLAFQEFIATRTMHRKDSPVYFYHYVQSFHPDEAITGEQAHAVAKEFAAKAWPNSEVLIATHIDAEHIHSHFIVNAVCFETGQMLRQGPCTLATLRPLSDEICLAHGLSVLPKQQKKAQGMSTREYRAASKGESWKFRLINVIDDCMKNARTRDEFIALMKSEGYGVRWEASRQSITYTIPSGYKCRDDRLHDARYLKEAMEREFRIRERLIHGGIEAAESAAVLAARNSTSGADDTAGNGTIHAYNNDTSHRAGMGEASGSPRCAESSHGGTDSPCSGTVSTREYTPDKGADLGAGAGCGGNAEPAGTGWEAERELLFLAPAQSQTAAFLPAAPVPSPTAHPGDLAGVVGSVVELGHALERDQCTAPIRDATTMPTHHARGKKRKLGLGQKEDDHEDEQTWQQTM